MLKFFPLPQGARVTIRRNPYYQYLEETPPPVLENFFILHKTNLKFYGGRSTIIPLPLNVFQKMLEDSRKASYVPQPQQVKRLFEYSNEVAASCDNENIWYEQIITKEMNWLK